jgi:hypothetical protein
MPRPQLIPTRILSPIEVVMASQPPYLLLYPKRFLKIFLFTFLAFETGIKD